MHTYIYIYTHIYIRIHRQTITISKIQFWRSAQDECPVASLGAAPRHLRARSPPVGRLSCGYPLSLRCSNSIFWRNYGEVLVKRAKQQETHKTT